MSEKNGGEYSESGENEQNQVFDTLDQNELD
jgi:hypothetical protein